MSPPMVARLRCERFPGASGALPEACWLPTSALGGESDDFAGGTDRFMPIPYHVSIKMYQVYKKGFNEE